MKTNIGFVSVIALITAISFAGCDADSRNSEIVAEGILFSVEIKRKGERQ